MSKCRSKKCKQEVKAAWSFCPRCGRDNRPKEFRPTIINCGHKYPTPKRYCVICGVAYGGSNTALSSEMNIRFGKLLLTFGGGFALICFYMNHLMGDGSGIGYQTVKSFYEKPFPIPGVATVSGGQIATYGFYVGLFFALIGFLGGMAARANKPKGKRGPKVDANARGFPE